MRSAALAGAGLAELAHRVCHALLQDRSDRLP